MHDSKYLYHKRTDNKPAFTTNVFKKFTDAVGGDAGELADIIYAKYTIEDFTLEGYEHHPPIKAKMAI